MRNTPSPYGELFRLLRPGGEIATVNWCLTHRFDPGNPTTGVSVGFHAELPHPCTQARLALHYRGVWLPQEAARGVV